jgi:hypothetical protein
LLRRFHSNMQVCCKSWPQLTACCDCCCLAAATALFWCCVASCCYIQSLIAGDDFQHILRVLNTNVDGKQKVMYAITAIRGIGRRFSNLVCKKAEVDMRKRCGRVPGSRSRGRKAAATVTATAAVAADQMPCAGPRHVPRTKNISGDRRYGLWGSRDSTLAGGQLFGLQCFTPRASVASAAAQAVGTWAPPVTAVGCLGPTSGWE